MFAKFHTAKWADMSEVAAHRMQPLLNITVQVDRNFCTLQCTYQYLGIL